MRKYRQGEHLFFKGDLYFFHGTMSDDRQYQLIYKPFETKEEVEHHRTHTHFYTDVAKKAYFKVHHSEIQEEEELKNRDLAALLSRKEDG